MAKEQVLWMLRYFFPAWYWCWNHHDLCESSWSTFQKYRMCFRSIFFFFWRSTPLRLSVASELWVTGQDGPSSRLMHVFAIGMHIIILAFVFTMILKVNIVLHMSASIGARSACPGVRASCCWQIMKGAQHDHEWIHTGELARLSSHTPKPATTSAIKQHTQTHALSNLQSSHSAESLEMDQKASE